MAIFRSCSSGLIFRVRVGWTTCDTARKMSATCFRSNVFDFRKTAVDFIYCTRSSILVKIAHFGWKRTFFPFLAKKVRLYSRSIIFAISGANSASDDMKKFPIQFSFEWTQIHWPAEGFNVPPVLPKLCQNPLFHTLKIPTKKEQQMSRIEQLRIEMNSPSKNSRNRYASCDKHSMHRGERARRSSSIFELRGIWQISGRKSVIWAILAGVVRKAEKIKSTTVFSQVKSKCTET